LQVACPDDHAANVADLCILQSICEWNRRFHANNGTSPSKLFFVTIALSLAEAFACLIAATPP
jgi:hypothetical protein